MPSDLPYLSTGRGLEDKVEIVTGAFNDIDRALQHVVL
jgi:hypothetical protein